MYVREYGGRMDHHHCKREAAKELLRNYLNVALYAQRERSGETSVDLNAELAPLIPPYDEYNPPTSLM